MQEPEQERKGVAEHRMNVVMIGAHDVGIKVLRTRLTKGIYDEKQEEAPYNPVETLRDANITMNVFDLKRYGAEAGNSYKNLLRDIAQVRPDAVVLCFDPADVQSFKEARELSSAVSNLSAVKNAQRFVVGTRCEETREISASDISQLNNEFASTDNQYIACSAKEGNGIQKLTTTISNAVVNERIIRAEKTQQTHERVVEKSNMKQTADSKQKQSLASWLKPRRPPSIKVEASPNQNPAMEKPETKIAEPSRTISLSVVGLENEMASESAGRMIIIPIKGGESSFSHQKISFDRSDNMVTSETKKFEEGTIQAIATTEKFGAVEMKMTYNTSQEMQAMEKFASTIEDVARGKGSVVVPKEGPDLAKAHVVDMLSAKGINCVNDKGTPQVTMREQAQAMKGLR